MATILFVDDDEMERYFAREILEPRGHRVLYAGDGESALRIFDKDIVDVVVTDLAMPRLNGLRLIQELRAIDPDLHIIAASGINADQLDLAEDFGAVALMQKPWDPRRFLETLDRLLSGERREGDAERIRPTLFAGIEMDEHGRVVRTIPTKTSPVEGLDDADREGSEPVKAEPIDLTANGITLDVEGLDPATGEPIEHQEEEGLGDFSLESLELDEEP